MCGACEKLSQHKAPRILEDLRNVDPVPVHPFNEAPYVLDVVKRSVMGGI